MNGAGLPPARSLLVKVADAPRIADGQRPRIVGTVFCSEARVLGECRTAVMPVREGWVRA